MIKSTGMVRNSDDLGRIVIPKEIRRRYGINEGDPLELFVADDMICLKPYYPADNYANMISKIIGLIEEDANYSVKLAPAVKKLREAVKFIEDNHGAVAAPVETDGRKTRKVAADSGAETQGGRRSKKDAD